MQYSNNFSSILDKQPIDLLEWLLNNFTVEIPQVVISAEDMTKASETMLQLSGMYSYLMALSSYCKIQTRLAKRALPKEQYEDMVDRKEVIQNFTDAIKQSYTAVSRAVTIYIENNNELRMGRGTP